MKEFSTKKIPTSLYKKKNFPPNHLMPHENFPASDKRVAPAIKEDAFFYVRINSHILVPKEELSSPHPAWKVPHTTTT